MASKFWALVAAAGTLLAACASPQPEPAPSSRPAAPTTSAGPTEALVTWVDGICRVRQESLWNPPPPVHATAVTEADRQAVVTYLTAGRDHFVQVTALVDGLGAAPVAGGDEVAATMRAKVSGLADQLGQSAQQASTFPDVGVPYRLALMDLASWSFGSPSIEDLAEQDPQVASAKEQAASC